MRRALFALAFALAVGSLATATNAAPTDGQQPPAATPPAPGATPTPPLTKPAKPTAHQRAVRACAKAKDDQAKADCQRRVHAQAKAAPRKTTKRKPVPPAPAATPAAATN